MSARTHVACPLCGGSHQRPVRIYRSQHLVRCQDCGFHFSERIPTEEELEGYYGNYPIKPADAITLGRYRELLDRFEPFRRSGLMLDVGCGGGDFLAEAARRGWTVHGTEYGDAFVAACRAKGISMHQGELKASDFPGFHFDVITSFEVIEHLTHPREMLKVAVRLLRPGGMLYVTTPNYGSISRPLAGSGWDIVNYPEHVSYFTARTLHRMLTGLGLVRASMHTTGFSITRLRTSHRPDGRIRSLPYHDDAALRRRFESSRAMRGLKQLINGTLDLFKIGDTLKAGYLDPRK